MDLIYLIHNNDNKIDAFEGVSPGNDLGYNIKIELVDWYI